MQHFSEKFGKLAEAMSKVQAGMKPAAANRDNPHFKSRYADLESVMGTVRPLLAENGLFLTQPYQENDNGVIWLTTRLIHAESEQWVESCHPLPKVPNIQQFGSALTYARRYMIVSMLGIVTGEEDDDGTAAAVNHRRHSSAPQAPQGRGSQFRRPPKASDNFDPKPTLAEEIVDRIRGVNSTPALKDIANEVANIKKKDEQAITAQENESIKHAYKIRRTFLANRDRSEAARSVKNDVRITSQGEVSSEESMLSDEMGYETISKQVQSEVVS